MPETTGIFAGIPTLVPQLPQVPGLTAITVPRLAAGRFTAPTKGWVHVRYTDAVLGGNLTFTRPPALIVVAEGRSGWFTPKQFTPPSIAIQLPEIQLPPALQVTVPRVQIPAPPRVTLPSVSITVPSITVPRISTSTADFSTRLSLIYPFNADWGVGIVNINWIRDGLRDAVARILQVLWAIFVQPQVDQVQNTMQGTVNLFRNRIQDAINSALSTARDNIQSALNGAIAGIPRGIENALNSFGTGISTGVNNAFGANRQQLQTALDQYRLSIQQGVNGGLSTVTGYATQTLNSVIPQLWALLGLPQNAVFVPVLFKASLDGFDWFAPAANVTVHYAAFGA